MMGIEERIEFLTWMGDLFRSAYREDEDDVLKQMFRERFTSEAETAFCENPWFTPISIKASIEAWGEALMPEKIAKWSSLYDLPGENKKPDDILGLVSAGNIPMVGLHDILCAILTGTRVLVKLSSDDRMLIPGIFRYLESKFPGIKGMVEFTEERLRDFNMVIATGSNNTSRYFEYYFGKYPNIIRKNRNGVALLTGEESAEDLYGLADDMLKYFGLGCRNVSKLYVPENYDLTKLLEVASRYPGLEEHNKYRNNYDYQKSILLINGIPHFDTGSLLLTENMSISSPISVVYFERYAAIEEVKKRLAAESDKLQCVVTGSNEIESAISYGNSQKPELWDYADGIDVVDFLVRNR